MKVGVDGTERKGAGLGELALSLSSPGTMENDASALLTCRWRQGGHWNVFKAKFKAKPTLKFLSPQKFIVSPKMVLQPKKVKQTPTIFSSHKTMTCRDVKVKHTAF